MKNSRNSLELIIIGAGNAALCAALSAHERGIKQITMLECAPVDESGGNSRFTAGAMRTVYNSTDDLRQLMPDLSDDEIANSDFGSYTTDQFFDDMGRVTRYRCDPDLTEILIKNSFETLLWMREQGVRFQPIWGRQAFKVKGKFTFWGGLTVEAWGGGPGLVDSLTQKARACGINISYQSRAVSLIEDNGVVKGVVYRKNGKQSELYSDAVVIASGGFEANTAMRANYLGPKWDLAKVRGSRFNTGDGINMALAIGASPFGHWSGCHAVGWDMNAPEFGDLAVGDNFQKHSYPFAIMLNALGERFVDEGADFRNYTYAKYGGEILQQPDQFAWQIFDQKTVHLQRDEYRIKQVSKVKAETLPALLAQCEGVDVQQALQTIASYNKAVKKEVEFNPNIKDGRCTEGLHPPKSNWANTIDKAPFEAYAVTCGITFTFGGLRVNTEANVLNTDMQIIPGLYAAGELIGGLFYHNYPGGTGLTSGAVFGKLSGQFAAQFIQSTRHR